MKVILLAAGQSKRVKPIEDKNFVRICGKYLIEHQLEKLNEAGFKDFLIIGNKFNVARIEALCRKLNERKKIFFATTVEQRDLSAGMAGAILEVENFVDKYEPILIVSSNDVVEEKAYRMILEASSDEGFDSFLIGKKVAEYFPGGYLKVDKKNRIEQIIEKPMKGCEPSDLVNIVIHFHRNPHQLIDYLKKNKSDKDDRYEAAMDKMIKDGKKIKVVPYDGFWQPIKFPWHFFNVFDHFFSQLSPNISKTAEISEKAIIKGKVIINDGVKILEGAIVSGPCYLGKNVVVANNALVRNTDIEEDSVVGFFTEVARSILGKNVWTHSNYIGDSIIGDDCAFGAGAVTGNLRLDEQNIQININEEKVDSGRNKLGVIMGNKVRAGINTSLMPGIKIGSNSFIGSGLVIDKDIPENSFVKGETTLKITKNKAKLKEFLAPNA